MTSDAKAGLEAPPAAELAAARSSTMPVPAAGLDDLWKRIGAVLESEAPLAVAHRRSGARGHGRPRRHALPARARRWVRAGAGELAAGGAEPGALPEPLPEGSSWRDGAAVAAALASRARSTGCCAARRPDVRTRRRARTLLAFLLGSVVGANRLSRQVRDAEFELKARLLELESLYDLGLSLGGQLDLSALADEVLFRSISLTDAGKGTLVLVEESGAVLLERSVGGEVLAAPRRADLDAARGRRHQQRRGLGADGRDRARLAARSVLAVAISVPGRRLGVLAVADKESRDGRVLDFTPTDARLLSLFANQAAAAIETARLHRDAIEKERIERELELAAAIQRQILPRDLPEVAGLEIAAQQRARRGRSAATTSTSSRSRAGGSAFSWRTSPARACRRRCSCRRSTRRSTSRSTRRGRSPSSSAASTGTSSSTRRRASS